MGLPRYPHHPSGVPCPLPRRIGQVRASIASPSVRPSPFCRRVGIRLSTFEACLGFTRVTAPPIAQPPKAAFVTRLRSGRLPDQTARQLPELSTIPWMDPSSTGDTRPRGARRVEERRGSKPLSQPRFPHRVGGGSRLPPPPTERSVQISCTTLFGRGFTALREPAAPGRATAVVVGATEPAP